MTFAGLGRSRAPILASLLALVLVSLLAAELVNIAIVLALPRPEPEIYRLGEIEQILAGQAPPAGADKLLSIRMQQKPPTEDRDSEFERRMAERIAHDLGVTADRVLFSSPFPRLRSPLRPPPPFMERPEHFRRMRMEPRLGGPPMDPQGVVFAPFRVSVKLADGLWRVIEPRRHNLLGPWEQRVLVWFLASVAILTPLAYVFARRLAAPIAAFAAAADRLGRDPNAPPLQVDGSSEIALAASAFNDMQDRLRRYVNDRTAMIGAVAHDLRTPLTRLRFHIEGAPESVRAKAAGDIAEMDAMVAAVLAFVRDGAQEGVRSRLELSSLLQTVADEFEERGADVRVVRADQAVINGDVLALKRMLTNLIDNAVKFGGLARVTLERIDGTLEIRIEDDGPGLAEGDLEAVFEPFRRVDPSRSRDTGGIGLGLTVARTIARAHGGDVVLGNRLGGGLLARVRLPG